MKKTKCSNFLKKYMITLPILITCFLISMTTSLSAYANKKHPIGRFVEYNFYNGVHFDTKEKGLNMVEKYNLILVNNPDYEYWEQLEKMMRDENDDYYDFLPYDYYTEGKRLYIYSTQEAVDAFIKMDTPDTLHTTDYNIAKKDFVNSLMVIYEYSLKEYKDEIQDEFATINESIVNEQTGTVCIQGYIDKEIIDRVSNSEHSGCVVLKNKTDGRVFAINLIPQADFYSVTNVTKGEYEITSASYSSQYPAVVSYYNDNNEEIIIYKDGKSTEPFWVNNILQMQVTFGIPMTIEDYKETLIEETVPEEETVIEVEEVKKKDNSVVIFIVIITTIIICGVSVFVFIKRTKDKANKPM